VVKKMNTNKNPAHRPPLYQVVMKLYAFRLPQYLADMLGKKERSKRLREILEENFKKEKEKGDASSI